MTYLQHTAPNGEHVTSDVDLPDGWSLADFTGGDPDERSYAQRDEDRRLCNQQIPAKGTE